MERIDRIGHQHQRESVIAYILKKLPDQFTRDSLVGLSDSELHHIFEQIPPGTIDLDTVAEERRAMLFSQDNRLNPHRRATRQRSWDS